MTTAETRPNLFKHAPGELSQDAFICWLVQWVNCEEDEDLQCDAKGFVAMLFNAAKHSDINWEDVYAVDDVRQQFEKIDVLFNAEVAGSRFHFLIEDKTFTRHHSDQLERYPQALRKNEDFNSRQIVCIYFKTGYLYRGWEDLEPRRLGYGIVDCKQLHEFFAEHRSSNANCIFREYADYISDRFENIQSAISCLFEWGDPKPLRDSTAAQWEFMFRLKQQLGDGDFEMNRGTNKGGQPYTEIRFHHGSNIQENVQEKLIYRLQKRKDGAALTLLQYAPLSKVEDKTEVRRLREEKLERLARIRTAFEQAKPAGENNLEWTDPTRQDKKGKNSSPIAMLQIRGSYNSIDQVLEQLPAFHQALCDALPPV